MISVTTISVMQLGVNHTFLSIQLSDQTHPLRAINLGAAASVPNLAGRHSYSAGRRGITTGGQVALVTLGYRKVVIRIRKWAGLGYPYRIGQPSQGLRRAPQKPHNSATRRPIPTGIPRTKRHTPVHLLCVLKIRKIAGQQRRCA